ncbi:pseudoazurin [Loktanella sp. M215]|uniref:pseudoazurin n=1 Tax=Loktanella sp. M215 TaxID=2675431 RepID=UPI001F02E44D|nr:pseudoazurin [Loktanella sp. M215]
MFALDQHGFASMAYRCLEIQTWKEFDMLKQIIFGLATGVLLAGSAVAETYEVQMLNRSGTDTMAFEPAFLRIAPGDTVKFIATDKGHNAEIIDGMLPDGAEAFQGKVNEEIEVQLDVEGLYAVKCLPHFSMGMVMTIAVGADETPPEGYLEGRLPPRAKERLTAQLEGL